MIDYWSSKAKDNNQFETFFANTKHQRNRHSIRRKVCCSNLCFRRCINIKHNLTVDLVNEYITDIMHAWSNETVNITKANLKFKRTSINRSIEQYDLLCIDSWISIIQKNLSEIYLAHLHTY